MKLLVVTPHLSTGGSPQYLLKYLQYNAQNYTDIKVIEFSNFSSDYVVQKNKIKNLIGKQNVICLGEFAVDDKTFYNDKFKLLSIINDYKPDIIWFNEFPECYEYKMPPTELMIQIYNKNRTYKIIETTHNNSFDFTNKRFIPDEFLFCSELHINKSKTINIIKNIWEVPIEDKIRPNRKEILEKLSLDPSYLHVLNVGLFNDNKNQKYIFDLAEKLLGYKIMFHFIGNDCFINDCGISKNQLSQLNCKTWGERNDVDIFMSCMDVFLFPSKKELNPLSVIEALSWKMEVICKQCDNYTYKYTDKNNFYILDNLDIKKFLIDKTKTISSNPSNINKNIKFAIYTSFYNCERYVDGIFDQISKINYTNYTWFITDDFSSDNTKNKILDNLNKFKSNKIKYVDQSFKKQMYWQPNLFIDKSYDYIVLIDADDYFDYNFLNIYSRYIRKDPSLYLLTSDFQKRYEENRNLHSMSLVRNSENLKSKINKFHPSIDYLNNLNYYCFGTLRCFKNTNEINFTIKDFDACAEDSFRMMTVNSFGKWLHIPRNLYTWNVRKDSESHQSAKNNFNANFNIAYDLLINSDPSYDDSFADLYKETCALNFIDINNHKTISLFTKNSNVDNLKLLYSDINFSLNDYSNKDIYIILLNDFEFIEIQNIISKIQNNTATILFYYLNDNNYKNNFIMDDEIKLKNKFFEIFLSTHVDISNYFYYIRHTYIIGQPKKQIHLNNMNNIIDLYEFDNHNCKLNYKLNNGEEGLYDIDIIDDYTKLLLYKDSIYLSKNSNYWTSFNYCKDIINDNVVIIFKKNKQTVYENKFSVNNNINKKPLITNCNFNGEVECYSFLEVFVKEQYSKHNINVEENDIVVDIGANVGAFIKLALDKKCDKIYACEPNPKCNFFLKKYFGNNKNIYFNEFAISNSKGKTMLSIDINNEISGSAKLIEFNLLSLNKTNDILVDTNTFSNFIKDNKINKIDFLKIDCEGGENYIFIDENLHFIKNNVKKIVVEYHNDYKTKIKSFLYDAGFNIIDEKITENLGIFYAKKNINIINESGSLGDFIAWTPIVNRYAEENNIKVNFYTPYKNIFSKSYPNINFYDYSQKLNINDGEVINLGCFSDDNWREKTLQKVASDILKLDHKEIIPKIHSDFKKKNNFKKKYVCIATQSTSQCKYWNNKDGWNKVVTYLKQLNYDVVCIDRYDNYGIQNNMNVIPDNCINKTGDLPLEDRINDLMYCEFFIGLGSGLSWLAWACNKPVIMISGFSDPFSEFFTEFRVHNKNVCNSCWNDKSLNFDKSNWLWCPRNKDFECSKQISFEMVKTNIDSCIQKNKQTKIKAVHILVDINDEREKRSIQSMSAIKDDIDYIQCINKRYEGNEWKNFVPLSGWKNHGPGHYGLFQSFKKAILENFTDDLDGILIFEADCVLNISKDNFIQNINKSIHFCEKHDLPYFSFGPRIIHGYLESIELQKDEEFPDFIITDKIIQTHCILLTKKYRKFLLDNLDNSWDSLDLWFNGIFKNHRMGIVKEELAYQTLGISMLDNCLKGEIK